VDQPVQYTNAGIQLFMGTEAVWCFSISDADPALHYDGARHLSLENVIEPEKKRQPIFRTSHPVYICKEDSCFVKIFLENAVSQERFVQDQAP
jgi:hypothetical protein